MSTRQGAARDMLANAAIHEDWVSKYRSPEAQQFYEMAFDEIARRLDAPAGSTFLDAGCGSCAKSVLLAARGFRVVASDFSHDALTLAAGTIRAHGVENRIGLRRGDLLNLPFRDGEFSYILCWGVLMHVPNVQRALAELARVLAPGGVLVISEANMHSLQGVGLRFLKRWIGSRRARVVRVAAGIETSEHTEQGTLLTRQTDMTWLTAECGRLGLRRKARIAGQLTELYVLAPSRAVRRAIHMINHVWFRWVGAAGPAFGNILMFEKPR